jgi:hypothetical protein
MTGRHPFPYKLSYRNAAARRFFAFNRRFKHRNGDLVGHRATSTQKNIPMGFPNRISGKMRAA